jgi:tetrahydromethanopterin S-methyltransferase subunit G
MDKRIDYIGVELGSLRTTIERKFEKVDDRFTKIDDRFTKIDDRFTKIDDRFTEMGRDMRTNFRWIVGINIMMWVTIIIAIIFR